MFHNLLFKSQNLTLQDLREWAADRLSPYQSPSVLKMTNELPRNTMGKVNKKELLLLFFAKE
jgi:malonyl-CoA/methylmalonyl-CoA synthetase